MSLRNSRNTNRKSIQGLTGALCGLVAACGASQAHGQQVFNWNAPGGGAFTAPASWNPLGSPGAIDHAWFFLDETYSVSLNTSQTNRQILVGAGHPIMTAVNSVVYDLNTVAGNPCIVDGTGTLTLAAGPSGEEFHMRMLNPAVPFHVGPTGESALNITANTKLTTFAPMILGNDDASAEGTVTVDGLNAVLDIQSAPLTLGGIGRGELFVRNGGVASVTDASIQVALTPTGSSSLSVEGPGSQLNVFETGDLIIGNGGTGFFSVFSGGVTQVVDDFVLGSGFATITSGGLIVAGHELAVGVSNNSTMGISTGGGVYAEDFMYIGREAGSNAIVNVTGFGSTLETGDNSLLSVGFFGEGALNIIDGGTVIAGGSFSIANALNNSGTVTVTGAGSLLDVNATELSPMSVGAVGPGSLNILAGADVVSGTGTIGLAPNSNGEIFVQGAGSTWTNVSDSNVGEFGNGVLSLHNGGTASVGADVTIAAGAGSSGTLIFNIGDDGTGAIASGQLDIAGALSIGAGSASINLFVDEFVELSVGDAFTLVDYGTLQLGFAFSNLFDDGIIEAGPYMFQINFDADLTGAGDFAMVATVLCPDECPECPADLDGSGDVAFNDLLVLLAAWDTDDAAADLDGDNVVGFGDLLLLLAAWGACS